MDWCDAAVYCAWAGKRLCGADDGGGPRAADANPGGTWTKSGEWFRACIGPEENIYSYGSTYVPTACNSEDMMGDPGEREPFHTTDVTEPPTCAAPWSDGNVLNLDGNAMEFEDNCFAAGGAGPEDDVCFTRGGSFNLMSSTSCDWAGVGGGGQTTRSTHSEFLGFRCCWTP